MEDACGSRVIKTLKDGTLLESKPAITFIEQIEDDLPDVWVDYFRLVQVLTNLVSNAQIPPDGGTITLCARLRDGRVEFCIEDAASASPKTQLRCWGQKFWRADDKFTRSQPGSGLDCLSPAALSNKWAAASLSKAGRAKQ
jgi:signal transduction histidine kinase